MTDTGHRMVFPLLPFLARGLGTDLATLAMLISARQAYSLVAPLLGSIGDLHGRKNAMLLGLAIFTAGFVFPSIWPTLPMFALGLMLGMTGKMISEPAVFAYIGDRVHITRRGSALAILEFGWAGAFLLGVPLMGWAVSVAGWAAPFPLLALLGLLASAVLWLTVPADPPLSARHDSLTRSLRAVLLDRATFAGLVFGFFIGMSNGVITIIYGAWLDDTFQLSATALGIVTAVLGLAELGGEGLVAALANKLDKRRAIGVGIVINLLAALAIGLLGRDIPSALLGLFLFFISFEFALVFAIPLLIEFVPSARATVMASKSAFQRAGFAAGTLVGPLLFSVGIVANSLAAAGIDLAALVILVFFVPGGVAAPSESTAK